MKVAIVTDTHFGVRQDSQVFLDNASEFFTEQFFPYIRKHKIPHIIHGGDLFDKRKNINIKTISQVNQFFVNELKDINSNSHKILVNMIAGNHDCYYKSTNSINSIRRLILSDNTLPFVKLDDMKPMKQMIGGACIGFVPWINPQNYDECVAFLTDNTFDLVVGHFEINGFDMMPGVKCNHGLAQSLFKHHDKVISGHFHLQGKHGNIQYLGSPYQMDWGDYGSDKGFWVYDTETKDLEFIENTNAMYHKIYWESSIKLDKFNFEQYTNKYVRIVLPEEVDGKKLDNFLTQLKAVNPYDWKVIPFSSRTVKMSDDSEVEFEDTPTLINNYLDTLELDLNKNQLKKLMGTLYSEAIELV